MRKLKAPPPSRQEVILSYQDQETGLWEPDGPRRCEWGVYGDSSLADSPLALQLSRSSGPNIPALAG